jgi:thiamine biosynthesis protein ThiC
MFCKEGLQSFALSAKAEKIAKGISESMGKEIQRASSAKDVEWQAQFKELVEQLA